MKKVVLIMMSFILMLGLVACDKESEKTYTFKGKVIEMYMNNLIVEPLENEDIRKSSDKIQVWFGQIPEFHPPIFPEGTLVEIEYDGNVAETYPAQINAITLRTIDEEGNDIIPPISQNEIPTTVAYANWAEEEGGLARDEKCLDADKYIYSDMPRLPLFKFESKLELDEFKDKYKDTFTMDQAYDEVPSFNDVTSKYDDEFFKSHSLMLAYKSANSGSFRYDISEAKKENETFILRITKLNNPESYTDDMAGWFLMAEVPKEYIADCKDFDAQLLEDYSGNVATIESNKITIKNGKNDYDSINVGRIESFIENSKNGNDDEIEVTQYTIEGDPVITTVRYNGIDGTFKTIRDTTQDKFGTPEIIKKEYDNSYKAVLEEAKPNNEVKNQYYKFSIVNDNSEEVICIFNY